MHSACTKCPVYPCVVYITGMIYLVLVICCSCCTLNLVAQTQHSWAIAPSTGTIFVHSKDVENTSGARPFGIQLDYAWRKTDSITYSKFFGLPTQGVTLSFFDFDNAVLGYGANLAYFIEPEIRFNSRSGLNFRTSAGVCYLSNPYDTINNPTNNSYSSNFSFYLAVGMQAYFQLTDSWEAGISGTYRHTSNAGVKLPNKGVNWITGELMVKYYPRRKVPVKPYLDQYRSTPFTKKNRMDLYAFGSVRSISTDEADRYPVAGLGLTYSKQTGRTHAFTIGAELYKDLAVEQQLKIDSITNANAVIAGILAGHEFLWGKFIFSQQLGVYVYDQTPYYPAWYHRWGLMYRFTPSLMAGVNLKANKQVADFPDVRLVYTF